ncbi:MAG: TerC family protein, partial [Deltaproteobacteria bacterium]|nr:TerC family protein [Deltaproteobacteria bacterium]
MFWLYFGFVTLILALLALDLGVLHRRAHVVGVREALSWSALWISLGVLFCVAVYFGYEHQWLGLGAHPDPADGMINDGARAAIKYLTAYLIEESLSVDNLFVIAMVFASFGVPGKLQHRVLYWGILGALVMRGTMIGAGAALIARFHWVLYLFGAFLLYTAYGMLRFNVKAPEPGHNAVVRLARRLFPVTRHFHGEHFYIHAGSEASRESIDSEGRAALDPAVENAKPGTLMLTPLALALLMVETCDVVFAIDSVPAIFSITADPFLVFTSNVFAILGLRSLFFALAGMLNRFHYLEESLAVVLALIGVKMLAGKWIEMVLGEDYNFWILAAVLVILLGGVVASLVLGERRP